MEDRGRNYIEIIENPLFQKMLLVNRHDKEMEQITRHNERLQKALEERQRVDRARMPKWQRNDGKTINFKTSLL